MSSGISNDVSSTRPVTHRRVTHHRRSADDDIIILYEEAYKKQPNNEEMGAQAFMAMIRIGSWKTAQQVKLPFLSFE